jgi:hypothetical protein
MVLSTTATSELHTLSHDHMMGCYRNTQVTVAWQTLLRFSIRYCSKCFVSFNSLIPHSDTTDVIIILL